MVWIGEGKLKSNPILVSISPSSSINYALLTFFFSSSVSKFIILVKLGEIGCSSLAAISMQMVANRHMFSLGKVQYPMVARYRSITLTATKSVSTLYSFLIWRSKIFWTA